ncbi:hypothetical protein [Desmospora activa]|uniref:Uncharacterized protein n=1 Tax=Desmospora activa DSM 45169 TaxID=1121389 RepID=A0A2T4ZB51_9BACL|nr:hypothetical protein [Desmospora activa]PTM59096.1 hypothetical protein C8J48_1698 [Desmospora activa DSM 45169]
MQVEVGMLIFQLIMVAIAGLFPLILALVLCWLMWRLVKTQESQARTLARIAEGGLSGIRNGEVVLCTS